MSDFGFEQLSSVGNSDHHSDCQLSQKQATNFAGCSDFKPIVWHIWPLISIQIFTLSLKNQWLQYHHCSKLLWIRFHWVDYLMKRHVSLYIYKLYALGEMYFTISYIIKTKIFTFAITDQITIDFRKLDHNVFPDLSSSQHKQQHLSSNIFWPSHSVTFLLQNHVNMWIADWCLVSHNRTQGRFGKTI